MNSVKTLMTLLESKRAKKAWMEMTSILKESQQYFQNVPANERGLILNVLFNEKTGILTFLNNVIKEPNMSKSLEETIIQVFNLLSFIMCEFSDVYAPYLTATQAVCTLALTMKAAYYLKLAATKAFLVLLENFRSSDLNFNDTVTEWVQSFKYCSLIERRLLLNVITTIAKYFPQSSAFTRYAKSIRGQLIADIALTCDGPKTKSIHGLVTLINATNHMMYNFPPGNEDIGRDSSLEKLYKRLKDLCTCKDFTANKQLMSALVNLFSEHLTLFNDFVYEDYEFWHNLLKSFVKRQTYGPRAIKALRIYYETLGKVLGRKNSEKDKIVFLNLKNVFEENLSDTRLCSTDLRLTVYGFSQIIEPCKNYFAEAGVEEMFSLIVQRTIPRYAREDAGDTAHFEEISDYQEALSRIIRYMPNVTIHQIRALTTLCSLLIKRFPELAITDQESAVSSLNRTIVNVRYAKEILYQDFISHIIHDGIVWSCSHMLLIDAELKCEAEELSKRPITYKNYVTLWRGLLNPENYASTGQNSKAQAAAVQRVVDETITTCVTLINTLNVNVKPRENNIFSDVKVSQTVENESDFRIFLNMIDLYVDVLSNVEHFLWTNTLQNFLYEIIKNSYKNPLISGFYKLAFVVLTSSGGFDTAGVHNLDDETFNLVLRYLWNTMDSVAEYPQELQISCLQLILNVPEIFVSRIVDRAVPAFKISLTIGLTNYEIATSALNALERWTKCLGSQCPREFVAKLVPCLDNYLRSEESSVELSHDIEESKRKTIQKISSTNDEISVEGLQKKILLFFGSLDSDVMLQFIHEKSLKTGATWGKKDLLKYSMPFPDVNLEISVEPMLPRIIELALSSGDRRTRVTASEVLHTVVALILGKTVPYLAYDPDRFTSLYEILCPALLRLGCDSDDVIMQIYNPLMMQLTHWLSSRLMLHSRATVHLVDSLFDGLGDETNSSLRDVSGIYLAEFVHWSIKQSTDRDLARSPTNINLIVQRTINFALDPSVNKRVAAAIAFNHLYKILRENDEIVDTYWLELLHAFVKSLDGCDDSRIFDALVHVERVLIEKSKIFGEHSSKRIKPPGFSSVLYVDTAKWIFEQCGSIDRNCRKKCIDLFESISTTVNANGTSKSVVTDYLNCGGIRGLNKIVIADLNEKFREIDVEGLEIFVKTLDLYIWLLSKKLVDNEWLFSDINNDRNVVFDAIDNFVVRMILVANDAPDDDSRIPSQESVRLKTLRCDVVLTLFDLIPVLLDVKTIKQDFVPDELFNEGFFRLVSLCLIEPQKLGFDSSNLQLTEELPLKLECLINSVVRNLSDSLMNTMKIIIANDIQRYFGKLFQFDEIISNESTISTKNIQALILLHKCHLLELCIDDNEITANTDAKIKKIFDTLKTEHSGENICFCPSPELKTYFQRIIELLLLDYNEETMKVVIQLLTNTTELRRSDLTTTISHGEYFLSVFKDVIIRSCLRNVEKTLDLLESTIHENPDDVLRIVEALVLYMQRHRTDYREILDKSADLILTKFRTFERSVNNLEHRRNVFLNIYAIAVRLKRTPLDVSAKRYELYDWILKELVECNKFKYKIRLLTDFLICLTDESSNDGPELKVILYNLKNEREITRSDDTTEKIIATPETVDCFNNLLKLLTVTKSSIVFDAVMNFAQGAGKLLCEDKVTRDLKLYFSSIQCSNVLKSVELAYKRFMNTTNIDERFDVLIYFLLPSLGHCDSRTMETFFERNIKEINSTIMQKPTEILHDRQQLFVSKIGCYNLVEIMFANLSKDRIDSNDGLISKNAVDQNDSNEKISKRIFRSTLPIRQLRPIEGDDSELFRRVQCAAYNCSISIVSMTKDERFYVAVFGENRDKNQLIWENIVDVRREYELRQTFKEYPKKREKLINIRKTGVEKKHPNYYSYLKSYDLATSTLSENICAYDLNAVNLIPIVDENRQKETMSVTLEVDDLNDHECMAQICGLLKHMLNNVTSRSSDPEEIVRRTIPKWMTQFCNSMMSEHANVRLFLLKIVLNEPDVFKPHADHFIEPITNTIYLALKDGPLNYVITDALVMLVDWREISRPKTERGRNLARLMFSFLVEKATAAPTRYIVRYNMTIIEMIVDAWHDCLQIPEGLNTRMSSMDRQASRLILIFLTNKMEKKIINRNEVWNYLEKCLTDWKIEEESVLQSFEAVGLILKFSEDMENLDESRNKIVEIARMAFRGMQKHNPGRLIKCVHIMCKACPELTEKLFSFVSSSQLRVERTNMAKCLEIFSLMIPKLNPETIVAELNYMQFTGLLENKIVSCEKICLQIVDQLVPILEPTHLRPMIELLARYSDHEIKNYREICYDAAVKLHDKYINDETHHPDIVETMNIGKKILLSGLLDPSDDVQKLATDFWSQPNRMRSKCSERLIDVLDAYTCGMEKNFLQIITLVILQLTKKSTNYEDKLFEPLHNCSYYDHDISVSWKTRKYESKIPLFAPSIASQWNQRLTQHSYAMGSSSYGQDLTDCLLLRATNEPQFEATFLGKPSSLPMNMTDDKIFAIPKQMPKNKVSRRFLANWSDASTTMEKTQAAKKFEEEEYRREYLARQRSSVKLYRKYRIGDFPDIEISHATVLGPMLELVKKDSTICKILIVRLIRSLIDGIGNSGTADNYRRDLSERLMRILTKRRRNAPVIPAIFEILFNVREIEFPWEIVSGVAKIDGLFAQGALLTERSLMNSTEDFEPPAKRSKIDNNSIQNCNVDRWLELADLYESMNEMDVVLSIFRGELFVEELHVASTSRAAGDWEKAEVSYRKALDVVNDRQTRRHCLQGMFECMSRLTKWKKLEAEIDSKVKPDLNGLLDSDDRGDDRWIAPWIFRVQTHRTLDGRVNPGFSKALQSYLQNETKCQRLKDSYGVETAVIVINEDPSIARDFLNGSCEKIREEWIQLSPLAVPLRSAAIVKLRGIYDIDCYLKTVESSDVAESSKSLLNSWENSGSSISDDLLSWEKHLSHRSHFTSCLIEKLNATDSQEAFGMIEKLRSVRIVKTLKLVDSALNQNNCHVAKKYLLRLEPEINDCRDQDLIDDFELNAVRCKYLSAEITLDPAKSIKYYTASWEKAHELMRSDNLTKLAQINVRQIISIMASSLADMSTDRPEFFKTLTSQSAIARDIFHERIDFDDVSEALNYYSFTNLRRCCDIDDDTGDCHLRLSRYCYDRIAKDGADSELSREFVRSTLRAMSCGSEEATHYFPCLLRDELLADDEIRQIFRVESSKIEVWRFLIWQTQLLSHLGTSMGDLVLPLIKKIIDSYPKALAYSLRLTLDTNPSLRNDPSVIALIRDLGDDREFNRFLEAVQYVVQPELYVEYHLREVLKKLSKNKSMVVDDLLKKIYPDVVAQGNCSLQGIIYRILAPYKQSIEQIVDLPQEDIEKSVVDIIHRLTQSLKTRKDKIELGDYSPWLREFVGRDIEVPGQYTGEKKPIPRYHAKIVKFESTVKVMRSKRKPIRITIVANNAKNYRLLVKFGEDLRLDQRVEQIFDVMNKTLRSDVVCSHRRLSIDTYQVLPLSASLGLLQWVDGTKTLNDYTFFSLDDSKKINHQHVLRDYGEWIAKAAPGKSLAVQYKQALLKYDSKTVIGKITNLSDKIGSDLLKNTLVLLSPSMDSFMSLRQNFVTSYATMCVAQWILGIGDRHLGNTLISIESGRSLGIDFGSAFGGAVDQSIPELMPFRLTPQIRHLLKPFNENDLMGATMTHVLRALRNGKGPLLACLNVVAHEQLNWEEHVHKLSEEMQSEIVDLEWLPAKKVTTVSKKLNGGKPCSITLEQLAERHSDKDYFHRYTAVVNGTDSDEKSKRSSLKEENLSPEEQVQCLIEQAMDLNVLGRTYAGWTPWL